MNKYNPNRPCSKCGHKDTSTYYVKQGSPFGYYPGATSSLDDIFKIGNKQDLIYRKCEKCGYFWYELPLDSEGKRK